MANKLTSGFLVWRWTVIELPRSSSAELRLLLQDLNEELSENLGKNFCLISKGSHLTNEFKSGKFRVNYIFQSDWWSLCVWIQFWKIHFKKIHFVKTHFNEIHFQKFPSKRPTWQVSLCLGQGWSSLVALLPQQGSSFFSDRTTGSWKLPYKEKRRCFDKMTFSEAYRWESRAGWHTPSRPNQSGIVR